MKKKSTPLPPFFRLLIFAILLIAIGFVVGLPTAKAETSTTTENGTTTEEKKEQPEKPFYQDELEKAFESGFLLGRGGSTIFEDDFNSYDDGDLNEQGNWSGNENFDVQGVIIKEGAKAIEQLSGVVSYYGIEKIGALIDTGSFGIYVRNDTIVVDKDLRVVLLEGESGSGSVIVWAGTGVFKYHDGNDFVEFSTYEIETWYFLQMEWRGDDHTIRYRINEENWTDWVAPQVVWTSGFDIVHLGRYRGDVSYWDYISETPYEEEEVETKELIQNTTTGAEFYLDKTISYGDFLVSIFLLILIILIIIKLIFDTEIPKRINFKRQ